MRNSDIEKILHEIQKFRDERDWKQFHNSKDLAICLSVESAELLELFLWKTESEIDQSKLKNELADVLYSAFLLSDTLGFNIKEIMLEKIEMNKTKYPIEQSKGKNLKYDEL